MATKSTEPIIGAHVNGGLKCTSKAVEIGAEAVQIFIGSPQTWRAPKPSPDEILDFKKEHLQNCLGPIFVHGNYLVNTASPDPVNYKRSVSNLHNALRMADAVGASGLIFHPGSTKDHPYDEAISRVVQSLTTVLEDYRGDCRLVLEVCAGSGRTIGSRFSQFRDIFAAMDFDKRLGVCWDTCHLFSAGYDIKTEAGLIATLDEFDTELGMEWLVAVHANDSKTPFNSNKDRHENIGQGSIGEEAFSRMLRTPALRTVPWILEVPGFEKKGPDRKNIELLKQLS